MVLESTIIWCRAPAPGCLALVAEFSIFLHHWRLLSVGALLASFANSLARRALSFQTLSPLAPPLLLPAPHPLRSLDTSEWMRNGDYMPSRLEAQLDAGGANLCWAANLEPLGVRVC